MDKLSKSNLFKKLALLVLILVLILLLFLFVRQYQNLQTNRLNHPLRAWLASRRSHIAPTAQDAGYISSWMTFDYVNRVFNIPPDYLKTKFNISDSRYPRLTINQYAQIEKATSTDVTSAVRDAVRTYLVNPPK